MSYALTSHEISDLFNTSDLGLPAALYLSTTVDQQQKKKIKDPALPLCAVVSSTSPQPSLPSYSPQQKWPETTVSRSPPSTITVAAPYYNEYPGADYPRHPHAVHPHQHQHSGHHSGHSNVAIQALTHQVHHQHPQQQPRHTQLPPQHHHRQYGHQVYPAFSEEPRGLESLGEINESALPPVQTVAHHSRTIYGTKPRARTHEQLELGSLGLQEDEDDQDGAGHYQHQSHHHSHHHHHISDHPPPGKIPRTGPQMGGGPGSLGSVSPGFSGGPQSSGSGSGTTVGGSVGSGISNSPQQHHQQMPSPAPRPRGAKIKFTQEDDSLLVDLKENKSLTWKQIAEFFPGRSSGTLQVRYCTRLKAKTTQWNDDTVQKLRTAMSEYESDRWRQIAAKVGSGFTATACKEKALELEDISNGGTGVIGNGNGMAAPVDAGLPIPISDVQAQQQGQQQGQQQQQGHHDHGHHGGHTVNHGVNGHGLPEMGGQQHQP